MINIDTAIISHLAKVAFRAYDQLRAEGHFDDAIKNDTMTIDPDFVYDAVADALDGSPYDRKDWAFDIAEAMVCGMIDNYFGE